ncbi:MAG: EutN/CcmL family microcompartment protein [Christensenellales bacterium]
MKIGRVTGTVVSTVKYERYAGAKLLLVRPIDLAGSFAGEEVVALDAAHAGLGDTVLINNDGGAAQMVMEDKALIASVTICGVVDAYTYRGKTIRTH